MTTMQTMPRTTKAQTDIRTGKRIVLVASISARETSPTLATAVFAIPGIPDPYVVGAGTRLILTGVSGRGATVLGDYWQLGEISVSGTGGTLFTFVPAPTTPDAISAAGGNVNYWTLAAPLSVAVDAGEALHFAITHAEARNASFTAILTGYLVDA